MTGTPAWSPPAAVVTLVVALRQTAPVTEAEVEAAAAELSARDPVIAALAAAAGPPRFEAPPGASHFAALVRSVLHQQLAGAAASAIHGRLVAALGGQVTPESVLALAPGAMRAAGLSASKAASILDLAARVADGTVRLDPAGLAAEADEEVVDRLATVRGIGRWTAEMFLIFQLGRLDVWPVADLGVRRGYGLAWQVPTPTPGQLRILGDPLRPFRSVAAWYCWRACEIHRRAPLPGPASGP
ncbi:MAG: DNA-3-methyladenine glycosylase family protein [Acidimicrobiales bacterium]